MIVIINKTTNSITRIISHCEAPQILLDNEIEITVTDQELIDAFNKGYEISYNQATGELYYEPRVEIDPEKAVLYEAVANLFEEVQALKSQLGGVK